ncbi:probable E3 ubiquitin-protein ligase HIP1 [Abrus precatorius]|uniref:RING-type E3 ubiquitin transferase n=1 Tax=Abrus precatorius TaxID=3816 RepID=A0A8B8KT38_ABRPR|nr:probable E3 ubiquitin-protein ligase HIP1 [Abrus precatorius]
MNHEGGQSGQVNSDNDNIENGAHPHLSIEIVQRLFPSSRPLIVESDDGCPDMLSRLDMNLPPPSDNIVPNNGYNMLSRLDMNLPPPSDNIVPNNGYNSGVALHESVNRALELSIAPPSSLTTPISWLSGSNVPQYQDNEGNNPPINLELSLSITQPPSGTQNQGARTSYASNVTHNVAPGSVVEEQGMRSGISTTTTLLPSKRTFNDLSSGEFFVGESSRMGAEAALSKRHTSTSHPIASNDMNTSFLNLGMSLQPFSEAAQTQTIPSYVNPQNIETNTPPQSSVGANIHSNSYTTGIQPPLSGQTTMLIETHNAPLSNHSGTVANSSSQRGVATNFHRVEGVYPTFESMSDAGRGMSPPYVPTGTEVMAPLYGQRNIQESSMVSSPVGTTPQPGNLPVSGAASQRNIQESSMVSSPVGTTPQPGNLPVSGAASQRNIQESSMVSSPVGTTPQPGNLPVSGAATLVGNIPNLSQQTGSLNTAGNNVNFTNAPPRLPQQSNPNESMQIPSRAVNPPMRRVRSRTRPLVHPWRSRRYNAPSSSSSSESSEELNPTTEINSGTENEQNSGASTAIQSGSVVGAIIPVLRATTDSRRMLASRVCSIMDHLRTGRTIVFEGTMVLDYSVMIDSMEPQRNIPRRNNVGTNGLTVEEIMLHLRRENFNFVGEPTPENKESCCICQEEFVDGEQVGRLDCVHRFHVECIKEWLMHKNVCPICKRTALAMDAPKDEVPGNQGQENANENAGD